MFKGIKDIKILKVNEKSDSDRLFSIYNQTLQKTWPLTKTTFKKFIFRDKSEDVKIRNYKVIFKGKIIGFACMKYNQRSGKSQLVIIAFDKNFQRKGYGTYFIDYLVNYLRKKGLKDLSIGSGCGDYLWPGIPQNLDYANLFFKNLKFRTREECVDMVLDLSEFKNKLETKCQYKIRHLLPNEAKKILAFEKKSFPNWYKYFDYEIKNKNFKNTIIAVNKNNEILGSLIQSDYDFEWKGLFKGKVGTFGALGVAEEFQHRGIGLNLSRAATLLLKRKGYKYAFLGWTYLIDWYGKLGYKVWRRYNLTNINV